MLYAYDVYFGDCFLLVFEYAGGKKRSVLIDFGSTGKGKPEQGEVLDDDDLQPTGLRLMEVAGHINKMCDGSLDVVVATHRHKDHIYGFGLKDAGKIILDCKPKIVIQPWTENPDDDRDLTNKNSLVEAKDFQRSPQKNFAAMLGNMHDVAAAIESEAMKLGDGSNKGFSSLREKILFAADDNKIKNRKAVENLQKMGSPPHGESHFVSFGYDKIDWEAVLPGVKVHVLGPPSLEDSDKITSATSKSDEFWSLLAMNKYFWSVQSATSRSTPGGYGGGRPLFGPENIMRTRPANVRWVIRQLKSARASQLLELVRFVDSALNNTSVILLFEVGDQKLLFPGDAQIENWQYVLDKAKTDPAINELLTETTLYKVGHHGSRNATPKSLWDAFRKRSEDTGKTNRLKTVISTMKGKHGESPDTAVPLPKMVEVMKKESDYRSTEDIENDFVTLVEIPVG